MVIFCHADYHRRSRPRCHSQAYAGPPRARPWPRSRNHNGGWKGPNRTSACADAPRDARWWTSRVPRGGAAHVDGRSGSRDLGASTALTAVDTSVVVACFASWHEHHDVARETLDSRPHLVAHCALEAFSVLTRLPPPHRAPAELVAAFLEERFPGDHLTLDSIHTRALVGQLTRAGVSGGASYDGLIAIVAARHDAMLLTLDRRAVGTYDRLDTRFTLIA